eukprot:10666853-Karenia_brevis.AAC.1
MLIGNGISQNVPERILCRLLPAAGLCQPSDIHDRWESGLGFSQLASSCNTIIGSKFHMQSLDRWQPTSVHFEPFCDLGPVLDDCGRSVPLESPGGARRLRPPSEDFGVAGHLGGSEPPCVGRSLSAQSGHLVPGVAGDCGDAKSKVFEHNFSVVDNQEKASMLAVACHVNQKKRERARRRSKKQLKLSKSCLRGGSTNVSEAINFVNHCVFDQLIGTLLIALSGDVHPRPGPASRRSKYLIQGGDLLTNDVTQLTATRYDYDKTRPCVRLKNGWLVAAWRFLLLAGALGFNVGDVGQLLRPIWRLLRTWHLSLPPEFRAPVPLELMLA